MKRILASMALLSLVVALAVGSLIGWDQVAAQNELTAQLRDALLAAWAR